MKYDSNNRIITRCNAPKMHHPKYYATTMLRNIGVAPNMMLTVNGFPRQDFPDIFLTFGQFPDFSLTAVNLPHTSSFSRKAVTLVTSNYRMKTAQFGDGMVRRSATYCRVCD